MFRLVALLAAFFIPATNSLDNRDVGSETAYGIPIICPENNVPVGQWDQFLIVDKPYKNIQNLREGMTASEEGGILRQMRME
jgi:hypothetical protein